ncbi:MAG TPA: response regulator, partial [Anaerolineales bacterium]|nr:response regulator [Anaerolineales bacterium]
MARYHILIVDDQRDVRVLLRSGLETLQLDLKVIDVPSAEEALLVLGKEPIDLMVADVRLPGMSGLELRAQAGRRMPTTQLILITGMTDENVKQQLSQAGVAAYFFKPIQIGLFLEEVCRCLGVKPGSSDNQETARPEVTPASVRQTSSNPLIELCVSQSVSGCWLLTGRGKILYEYGRIAAQNEVKEFKKTLLGLLAHDRQQVHAQSGITFPCHHLFPGQGRDLWVTSLGFDLVLAFALPAGEVVHQAAGMLREIGKLHASLAVREPEKGKHPAAVKSAGEVSGDKELSAILGQGSKPGMRAEELDAYWD